MTKIMFGGAHNAFAMQVIDQRCLESLRIATRLKDEIEVENVTQEVPVIRTQHDLVGQVRWKDEPPLSAVARKGAVDGNQRTCTPFDRCQSNHCPSRGEPQPLQRGTL